MQVAVVKSLPCHLFSFIASQNISFIPLQVVSSYFFLFSSSLSSTNVKNLSSVGGWLSNIAASPPHPALFDEESFPLSTLCRCIFLKTSLAARVSKHAIAVSLIPNSSASRSLSRLYTAPRAFRSDARKVMNANEASPSVGSREISRTCIENVSNGRW